MNSLAMGITQRDIVNINEYNRLVGVEGVSSQTAWNRTMLTSSATAQRLFDNQENLVRSGRGLVLSQEAIANATQTMTIKAKAAEVSLKALSVAGNMLMFMGISMAISGIIKGFQALANAQENAIEKANEFISKFEEQRDALSSNKQTIDSISSDYQKLAKGVDSLGRNVSLNSDEYARYNEIVNQIADIFPQMVQGYTDEGNAIIAHKGNVEELTKAYEEQKKAAQDAIIVGSADVFKGFKAKVDHDADYAWEESGLLQMKNVGQELLQKLDSGELDYGDFRNQNSLVFQDFLQYAGVDLGTHWTDSGYEEELKTERDKIVSAVDKLIRDINAETVKIKPIMQAYLDKSLDFQGIDEKAQDVVKQIVGQFDSEFYAQFGNETEMATWVTENVVDKFKGKDGEKMAIEFGAMFDLQTKFNEGDITVAEYQEKLSAFLTLIGSLPDETQKAIKLLFGIKTGEDGTETSDFDTMINNVKEKFKGKFEEEIGALSLPELEILANLDISPEGIESWSEVETLIANAGKEANKMTGSLETLSKELDAIQSAYQTVESAIEEFNETGALSVDTYQSLTELEAKYIPYLIDEQGNLTLTKDALNELTAARIREMAVKQAEGYIDYIASLGSEEAQIKALTGVINEETNALNKLIIAKLQAKVTDGVISEKVAKQMLGHLNGIIAMADSAIAGLNTGGLSKNATDNAKKATEAKEDYAKKVADINEDLAEKEKDFAEKMAEAWKEEHLAQLKDDLEKRADIINRYKKDIEIDDFGLGFIEEDDFSNKSDLLTSKLSNLTEYGKAMREEFDRVANIIPQTGDEAEELANRLEELGSEMRDNVSNIRETTVALQKLSIDMATTVVDMHFDRLQSEIDNVDRRIKILRSDYKDDYKNSSDILNMDMLLPVFSDYDRQRREKQREDQALIDVTQETQDTINEIVTKSLEMQSKENAKARAKERQKLIEDMEKARQDAQEKLDEAYKDLQEHLGNSTTAIEGFITDTSKLIDETDFTFKVDVDTFGAETQITSFVDYVRSQVKQGLPINPGEYLSQYQPNQTPQPMGPPTPAHLANNSSGSGAGGSMPYFNQGDYSSYKYGGKSMSSNACAPTSMAMILSSFGYNVNPIDIAKYSESNGFYTGNGTSWGLFSALADDYNLKMTSLGVSSERVISSLKAGKPVLISVTGGTFNPSGCGHIFVLSGIDKDGRIIVNDPGSSDRTSKTWDIDTVLKNAKNTWSWSQYASGTPQGNAKAKNLGIAGENYKPEILIDKATGKTKYIDSPTVIDTSKTDVVGEKQTAKIPKFANGTISPEEIAKYIRQNYPEITDAGIAAILANIDQESGFDPKNEVTERYGSGSNTPTKRRGLFQIDDGRIPGWSNIVANGTWQDQIDRAISEGRYENSGMGSNTAYNVWDKVLTNPDLTAAEAAKEFDRLYERSDGNSRELRATNATKYYNDLPNLLGDISSGVSSILIESKETTKAVKNIEYDPNVDYMEKMLNATTKEEVIAANQSRNKKIKAEGLDAKTYSDDDIFKWWKNGTLSEVLQKEKDSEFVDYIDSFYATATKDMGRVVMGYRNEIQSIEDDESLDDFEKTQKMYDVLYQRGKDVASVGKTTRDFVNSEFERWIKGVEDGTETWSLEIYNAFADTLTKIDEQIFEYEDAAVQYKQAAADDRWDNSQNWISDRDFYNDWSLFGDSQVDAWERVVKWLKDEYPKELDKIHEAERNLFDARKQELLDSLEFSSSKISSIKALTETYYDTTNSIAEAQHEIKKELNASLTMYEYLDEETRKLLFNQEDYNILMEELTSIQTEADNLLSDFNTAIEGSTKDNLEQITAEYEMQYETLMKSYEIKKADLEVLKKQQQLNNVLNERNVRMLINGKWEWVANTQDVINAQEELAEAEWASQQANNSLSQTRKLNKLTTAENILATTINSVESGVVDFRENVDSLTTSLEMINTTSMPCLNEIIFGTASAIRSFNSEIQSIFDRADDLQKKDSESDNSDNIVVADGATTKYIFGIPQGDDLKYVPAWKLARLRKDGLISGYYNGTKNAEKGLKKVNEKELPEGLMTNDGTLIPMANFAGGEMVFNHKMMENLWHQAQIPWNIHAPNISAFETRQPSIVEKGDSFYGDINVYNPTDWNDFMRQLNTQTKSQNAITNRM